MGAHPPPIVPEWDPSGDIMLYVYLRMKTHKKRKSIKLGIRYTIHETYEDRTLGHNIPVKRFYVDFKKGGVCSSIVRRP